MELEQIIADNRGTIVDVRTRAEFSGGNVENSINIPLQEIQQRVEELKNLKHPLILCCASGNRSGQAFAYLSQIGIECFNAGSWMNVNYLQRRSA